jgi:hypothetical protein
VLYRLSYGLECVDNAHPYVGFAPFPQVVAIGAEVVGIVRRGKVVKRQAFHHPHCLQKLNDDSSMIP